MTLHAESLVVAPGDVPLNQQERAVLDRFSQLVTERAGVLAQGKDCLDGLTLVKRAVAEAQQALAGQGGATAASATAGSGVLPVSKLKVSEVVGRLVALSQASFYRAVENKRFYYVIPPGRAIGKAFPAWQFVAPVPELIPPVLELLNDMPSSDIHAFWVSEAEALNDLSPAEVLGGLPFETRRDVHPSQWPMLRAPAPERLRRVTAVAESQLRSVADVI